MGNKFKRPALIWSEDACGLLLQVLAVASSHPAEAAVKHANVKHAKKSENYGADILQVRVCLVFPVCLIFSSSILRDFVWTNKSIHSILGYSSDSNLT